MSERIYGDDALLTLSGELDLAGLDRLAGALERCLADRLDRIVIDAADLWFMGACGVSLIATARERAADWGGEIVVRELQPAVARVLALCSVPAARPATAGAPPLLRLPARRETWAKSAATVTAPQPVEPAPAA